MKFEHLIEINDILNPLAEVITRRTLWRGLVLRAESRKLFVSYLDDALIEDRTEASMTHPEIWRTEHHRHGAFCASGTCALRHRRARRDTPVIIAHERQKSRSQTRCLCTFNTTMAPPKSRIKKTRCTTTIAVPPIRPPTSTRYG